MAYFSSVTFEKTVNTIISDYLMMFVRLFNGTLFTCHFFACFLLILLPTIFQWDPVIGALDREKLPIYYALGSIEYKITLYCSLAMSFPMMLQILFRVIIDPSILFSFYRGLSNIILVMWIIATDAIILSIVVPHHDLIIYNLIIYLRAMCLVWSVGIYLYLYSECIIWQSQLTIGTFIGINTTRIIIYYDVFFKTPFLLQQINSIMIAVCYIVLLIQCARWFFITRKKYKNKQISTRETFCGIYIISVVGTVAVTFCIFAYYRDALWFESDGYNLSAQTIAYTTFYVIFAVFQGSAFEREAQASRVALEVKQLFIRYMSHEMRTPLNTVMMGLQHLKEEMSKPGGDMIDALKDVIEEIEESCDIALRTLNDMLLHDKIEAGYLTIESESVRVAPLLQDVIRQFQCQARQGGINLSIAFLDNSHSANGREHASTDWSSLLVSGDPSKLAQVFRNIISNSLKFTPRNGSVVVRISVVIDNPRFSATGTIKIEVIDSGVGISLVNQEKLFQGTIQFMPGKLQNGGGTGLGLYISKGIMDAHHGSLTVTSDGEGRGSTFTVTLPLVSPMTTTAEALVQYLSPRNSTTGAASVHPTTTTTTTAGGGGAVDMPVHRGVGGMEGEGAQMQKQVMITGGSTCPLARRSSGGHTASLLHLSLRSNSRRYGESREGKVEGEEEAKLTDIGLLESTGVLVAGGCKPVVLVVDDVASNRKMLKRLLVGRCSCTMEAEDGQEALEKVREAMSTGTPIDVITMDYQMPVMDGPTATRKIRELGYSGIILGVTGNVLPLDISNFITAGANRVLSKPLNIKTFDAVLLELYKKN